MTGKSDKTQPTTRARYAAWRARLHRRLLDHKKAYLLWNILRTITLIVGIVSLVRGNYEAFVLCMLSLVLYLVPSLLEQHYEISVPDTLLAIIICFIFAAEVCGETLHFYTIIPFWDTLLHTLNGFLAAAIGFSFVSILNHSPNIEFNLSPFFCALVAFCFSMTIGVLWEFFEFFADALFSVDMQKDTVIQTISSVLLDPAGSQTPIRIDGIESVMVNGQDLGLGGYLDIGLIDTMRDLIVNAIGALVFAVIGYFYILNQGKGGQSENLLKRFIVTRKKPDHAPDAKGN